MPEQTPPDQVWRLTVDGRRHRVEARGSISRRLHWYVDDVLVAEQRSSDGSVRLAAEERPGIGVVGVRFNGLGKPRRATLFEHDASGELDASARAVAGIGGLDLEPDPGSPAAVHEDRIRAHPRRYALLATLGGVAKVLLPFLLAALAARLVLSVPLPDWDLPKIPWPDLPRVPWPDLPAVPWPDLPSVPWPDWSLPGWLAWVAEHVKYIWPVVLAYVLARGEIKRRRKQDELRAARSRQSED